MCFRYQACSNIQSLSRLHFLSHSNSLLKLLYCYLIPDLSCCAYSCPTATVICFVLSFTLFVWCVLNVFPASSRLYPVPANSHCLLCHPQNLGHIPCLLLYRCKVHCYRSRSEPLLFFSLPERHSLNSIPVPVFSYNIVLPRV